MNIGSVLAKVREFHLSMGVPAPASRVEDFPKPERDFRIALIDEEGNQELVQALLQENIVETGDGLADLLYVVLGANVQFGTDPSRLLKEGCVSGLVGAMEVVRMAIRESQPDYLESGSVALIAMIVGVATLYDLPLEEMFDEVQRSNMSKMVKPHDSDCALHNAPAMEPGQCDCGAVMYREDGKVIKPETYSPANILGVIEQYKAAQAQA